MSLPKSFPIPQDAPPPGACIKVERPEPGLAVLVFDPPHRSLAVFDGPLLRDLDAALAAVEADASLQGLVLTGRASDQFLGGADVEGILQLEDEAAGRDIVLAVHAIFARVAHSRLRTVAAIGGAAPGGAYELALCCDRIVATDDKKTQLGLPEVKLGIFPGWGGVHRLPRRVGIVGALDAILSGRLFAARDALRRGLVDRVTKPELLRKVAADLALGRSKAPRRRRGLAGWLVDRNPLALAFIGRRARAQIMRQTRGRYPAPLRALDLVLASLRHAPRRFAEVEAAAIGPLVAGPISKNLVRLFLDSETAKKQGRAFGTGKPRRVERAGVVGGGVMGGAIASLLAEKGCQTRLADLAPEALDAALHEHRAGVTKLLKQRRLAPADADAAIDRLDVTRDTTTLRAADVVIEAVAERLDVKRKVLGSLATALRPDAILATNTSSLSVDAIADGLPQPERVVGLHFFNPVRKMPLVEVVRGTHTSDEVVATACSLAVRLGKTPVVVRDVAGFLVNRCLGPYLDEAVRLFVDGADPAKVDRLLVEFGMPMGPFALLDEVGFDIAAHAGASLQAAYGGRMQASDGLASLIAVGRLGKKSGHGFYRHDRKGQRRPVVSDFNHFHQRSASARALTGDQLVDRLILPMVNEAIRCLAEGVVASAAELDLAMVFGTGFAPFLGGPLRWADSVGLRELSHRMDAVAASADVISRSEGLERFLPTPHLRVLVKTGGALYAPAPVAAASGPGL